MFQLRMSICRLEKHIVNQSHTASQGGLVPSPMCFFRPQVVSPGWTWSRAFGKWFDGLIPACKHQAQAGEKFWLICFCKKLGVLQAP